MDKIETTQELDHEAPACGVPIIECSPEVKDVLNWMPELRYKAEFVTSIENGISPDGILLGTEKFDEKDMESRPKLKVISRIGTGTDNIDLAESNPLVILEENYTPLAVAEYDFMTMIKYAQLLRPDLSLSEIKFGIIGYGRIGKAIGSLLEKYSLTAKAVDAFETGWSMDDVILDSDVLFIHIPYTQQNKGFVDYNLLMRFNGFLVVAPIRSGVFDWESLRWRGDTLNAKIVVDCEVPYGNANGGLRFVDTTHHTATRKPYWFTRMVKQSAINAIYALNNWNYR